MAGAGLKYPQFVNLRSNQRCSWNMKQTRNLPVEKRPSLETFMEKLCRHTRVRVVAREEDAEFVECQECGDVFDASEFRDMAIEESIGPEEA